jgi:hypothetical protein
MSLFVCLLAGSGRCQTPKATVKVEYIFYYGADYINVESRKMFLTSDRLGVSDSVGRLKLALAVGHSNKNIANQHLDCPSNIECYLTNHHLA